MANDFSEYQKYRKKKARTKIIALLMVISGILVLIVGINNVRTGFAGLDDFEPTVGLYIGGIFSIIGGIFLAIAGIITFFVSLDDLKEKLIHVVRKIADGVEIDRRRR